MALGRLRSRRRLARVAADLTSARQLADRAQDQFDALKAKTDGFPENNAWGTQVEPDKDGWVLQASIPQQPPETWWMDLGDLADNARAALNHLAFQLVIASGNDPAKGRVQFPIFDVEDDYLRGGMKSNREKMLAGIAKRHRKLIDDAQPYKLGADATDHPLSILRSLTNRHKHREQHVGAAFLEQFTVMQLYGDDMGVGVTIGRIENAEPILDKHPIHAAHPTEQSEIQTPPELVARGWPRTGLVRGDLTGLDVPEPPKYTVGFFGDRSVRIVDIERIPPYVTDLIERFERRIVGKRPSSRPSR
jgi:hypothetical protein